jgi:hypothetical protein
VIDDLTAFVKARLDDAERTVYSEGTPPKGVIAWLTYLQPDGSMGYTTVASGGSADGLWIADGGELPEPASVLVVYDPVRKLRDIALKRAILAEHKHAEAATGNGSGFGCQVCHDYGDGIVACGWCATVSQLGTEFPDHPDYKPDWKPRPPAHMALAEMPETLR